MNDNAMYELLYRLNVQADYDLALLKQAFLQILNIEDSNKRNVMLGSLLTSLMAKTPKKEEIVVLLDVAFSLDDYEPRKRVRINQLKDKKIITMVGSGKKGIKTINISTASAILASSMGAYVVKPGSYSTSSVTGSADFMDIVGAEKNISTQRSVEILEECGFAFFNIEDVIPNFDKVYGGNFYVPHILSFGLAGLVCPIKTDAVLYGLAHSNVELSLDVLREFDIKNAMVVSSTDDNIHFIDEMGIFGTTRLIGTKDGTKNGKLLIFNPLQELKLPSYTSRDIKQADNPIKNVQYIIDVLSGHGEGAHEDIVCINCANILYLSGMVSSLKEGFLKSKEIIKSGLGLEQLIKYIKLTGGNNDKINKLVKVR
ncbi:MAG: hypothetical protein PHX04_03945 [Bacilli bacterium]|nr:hypothetical protein [Bacilli bacterium]